MGLKIEIDSVGEWTFAASGIDYLDDEVLASVAKLVDTAVRVCSGEPTSGGRLYRADNQPVEH